MAVFAPPDSNCTQGGHRKLLRDSAHRGHLERFCSLLSGSPPAAFLLLAQAMALDISFGLKFRLQFVGPVTSKGWAFRTV